MLTISQAETTAQIESARELMREYLTWWQATEPASFDQAPTFQGYETELASLPGIYAPPAGRLLLAVQDGQAAGCVCLKPHTHPAAGELKRLYVRPAFRGQNIGGQLVARLVAEARRAGHERLVLDTHISMKPAQAIYQAAGFRIVSPPADFVETLAEIVVFMEFDL